MYPVNSKQHQVPPSTNQYRTKYQPVPPSTDPVPSYIIFKCQTFLCRPEMTTVVRKSSYEALSTN